MAKAESDMMLFQKRIDRTHDQIRQVKSRVATIDDEIEIGARELRVAEAAGTPDQHKRGILENDLISAQIRRDETQAVGAFYKRINEALRRDAVFHRKTIEELEQQLKAATEDLSQLQVINADAVAAADAARSRLENLRSTAEARRTEQTNQLDDTTANLKATLIRTRERTATSAAAALTGKANNEPIMPSVSEHDVEEVAEESHYDEDVRNAATALIEVAGALSLEEAVSKFQAQEGTEKRLSAMANDAQARIDKANAACRELEGKAAIASAPAHADPASSLELENATAAAEAAERSEATAMTALADTRALLQHLLAVTSSIALPGQEGDFEHVSLPPELSVKLVSDRVELLMSVVQAAERADVEDESDDSLMSVGEGDVDPLTDEALWGAGAPAPQKTNLVQTYQTAEPALGLVHAAQRPPVLNREDLKAASRMIVQIETEKAAENKKDM